MGALASLFAAPLTCSLGTLTLALAQGQPHCLKTVDCCLHASQPEPEQVPALPLQATGHAQVALQLSSCWAAAGALLQPAAGLAKGTRRNECCCIAHHDHHLAAGGRRRQGEYVYGRRHGSEKRSAHNTVVLILGANTRPLQIWPLEAFLGAEYAQADRKHTAQLCEATVTVRLQHMLRALAHMLHAHQHVWVGDWLAVCRYAQGCLRASMEGVSCE